MIRGRLHRKEGKTEGDEGRPGEPAYIEINAAELTGAISVPSWLRDIGLMSWLLVGVGVFLVALIWLASLTSVIVLPVIVASIIADQARGREILVSSLVREIVESRGDITFGRSREVSPNGISGVHRLHPILWEGRHG